MIDAVSLEMLFRAPSWPPLRCPSWLPMPKQLATLATEGC